MYTHTYAHQNACASMTPSTRWSTDTKTHNLCTNFHTLTYTHVYKCIDVKIHTHMHIHKNIHVRTHTHICTHTYKMYVWNARKHAWNDGAVANVQGAVADQGSFALLFRSTHTTHISHLQGKDFIVPTSCRTNTPPSPILSSQHTPKQFEACATSQWPLA